MRAVLLHEAEMEFWASVGYYEEQEPGLGVRFKLEVDDGSARSYVDRTKVFDQMNHFDQEKGLATFTTLFH